MAFSLFLSLLCKFKRNQSQLACLFFQALVLATVYLRAYFAREISANFNEPAGNSPIFILKLRECVYFLRCSDAQ